MFRTTIFSALLIDFDNILTLTGGKLCDTIPNWVSWLEDGQFDPEHTRRKLRVKRVYWNKPFEHYRAVFEQAGFDVIATPSKIELKKSAADMSIALDALEMSYEDPLIEEYIILTTDTDFVPLLEKLGERMKKTVAAASENNRSFRVYKIHADLVIPSISINKALAYQRPVRKWWQIFMPWLQWRRTKQPASKPGPTQKPDAVASKPVRTPAAALTTTAGDDVWRQAANVIIEVGRETPGTSLGRSTVIRNLRQISGFRPDGRNSFFGTGSYRQFIKVLAQKHPALRIQAYGNGGISLIYQENSS